MSKIYTTKCRGDRPVAPTLAPLVQEISWSKIIVIIESCKDKLEREFYIRMARKFGWSKNEYALSE